MNATDQTERSWQPDERRRKDNIKLIQLSLATYNVQTLQQLSKLQQLTRKAAALPSHIIAAQEHKMVKKHDTMKSDNGEFLLQKVGGVGFLIRNKQVCSYPTSEKISDRIIKAYFYGNTLVTIIAAHAPTERYSSK